MDMHILTKSKISLFVVFVNFSFTVWLMSEGYLWQGIGLLWVMLFLSAIHFFHLRNKVLYSTRTSENEQNYNYSSYLRKCIFTTLESNSGLITAQSSFTIVFRIAICMSVVLFCLYNIVFSVFSYFPYMIFNKLMYTIIIVFAVLYLVAGLRFCAFPAFVSFCLTMGTYYLQTFLFSLNLLGKLYGIIFYANIAIAFVVGYIIALYFIKRNYIFSNLQSFEHFGNYQIADLYLNDFAPLSSYETLLKFKISLGSIKEGEILDFTHRVLKLCRDYKVILAGVIVNKNTNSIELYCYSDSSAAKPIDEFTRVVVKYAKKKFSSNAVCKKTHDSKWLVYKKLLFPSSTELCSIISRKHIEDLFVDGKTFDKNYELSFLVYFKEKKQLIAFENILELYGFELVNASFEGMNANKIKGYPYCGEYKTTTYISVRRLECLNKTILDEAEKFGCHYIGDWKVNE